MGIIVNSLTCLELQKSTSAVVITFFFFSVCHVKARNEGFNFVLLLWKWSVYACFFFFLILFNKTLE